MISRRQFLEKTLAAAAVVPAITAQSPWGGPVLDIHLHPRREPDLEINHIEGSGVTKAVLLPGASREDRAKDAVVKHPSRFVRFTNPDVTKSDVLDVLGKAIGGGAIGIGELQYRVLLDGPEMRRIYAAAAEFNVPVLIHFQDGTSNSGFARLPALLKEYSKTIFIGHATSWWAHISADVNDQVSYPTGPVKLGGLTDRMLADYPNLYGDLSANSGRNALTRDPDFAAAFVARHQSKLLFGSDCGCRDGHGADQPQSAVKGMCVARETLSALQRMASSNAFRRITWENGITLLRIKG